MDPKIDTFGQVDTRDLAIRRRLVEFLVFHSAFILGVKKVVFLTFSKLFWSCLGSVWASVLVLKGKLVDVF